MKTSIAILVAGAVLTASPAYAYVDPGTGGMLVQLVTGGVAGLIVIVKLYWRRIKGALLKSGPDGAARQGGAQGADPNAP
jgi:hypothetical protein